MKSEWKFIGFDLGAESGRCFAAVVVENQIHLNEIHRFFTHTIKTNNRIYWNTEAIFDEILYGLAKAKDEFGSHFDGIGIDTWGVDYALINSDGSDTGYPFQYRDDRTDGIMDEAFQFISRDELYHLTGTQSAQYNTLFQLLAEKKSKANSFNKVDSLLLMPDYFNFKLSGVKKTEYSIASTTNLTDPTTRNWSMKTIDVFGLPRNIFPDMIEPGTKLGTLLPSIAEKTGLSSSIPVFAIAGHDTASAVASIPASGPNWAFLSSGTWSLMGIELNNPIVNSAALKYNFTNEGGYNKTTRFLKNIVGLWPIQECRKDWKKSGKEFTYTDLTSMAKVNGLTKVWIDLLDPRFLKPGRMPEKISDFICETKQEFREDQGFIINVILESLAYTFRKTIKQIEEVTEKEIELLHIVGGGIQNELLTQYTADATGKTVLAGPVEGAIFGNIGIQAIAAGAVKNIEALRNISSNTFTIKEYKPTNAKYFNDNEWSFDRIMNY